ncbi:MAG: VWA domain-containing protein, partial [Burkholderiales bacterium]
VTAWFLVDLSGSVNFGGGATTKRARAVEFVALVARLLTRYGNRVGAVLYTDRVDLVLPARGGRQHLLHLMDRMQKTGNAPGPGKATRLGELLGRALQAIKRRSVVFVLSDFISDPGWTRALSLLGRRHEILAVRLYDALEMELPDLGLVIVEDAETGQQLFVDIHDAAFRARFSSLAAERETALRAALSDAGADCIELSTEDDLVDTLMRFSRLRKRRAQLASGGVPPALIQ